MPKFSLQKKNRQNETSFDFIGDKNVDVTISYHNVSADKMTEDIFTKFLPESKVEAFRITLI